MELSARRHRPLLPQLPKPAPLPLSAGVGILTMKRHLMLGGAFCALLLAAPHLALAADTTAEPAAAPAADTASASTEVDTIIILG